MMQDWMTWVFDGIGSTIFSFTLENEDVSKDGGKIKNNFQQSQRAGDNAEQVQIGGIKRGH